MKKITMACLYLVLSTTVFAKGGPSLECYERLLQGRADSAVHQINVADISSENTLKSMTITALHNLLRDCGCDMPLKNMECGQAIPGNDLTNICYIESDWGYFLVNKDYLDNLNIIFNRWD